MEKGQWNWINKKQNGPKQSKNKKSSTLPAHTRTHTHTHTYIYIYIYICVCVCVDETCSNNEHNVIHK